MSDSYVMSPFPWKLSGQAKSVSDGNPESRHFGILCGELNFYESQMIADAKTEMGTDISVLRSRPKTTSHFSISSSGHL